MLRDIVTIFQKELREVLRDRKTLMFMFALPLVAMPALIFVMSSFMENAKREASERTLTYAVFNAHDLPELVPALEDTTGLQRVEFDGEADIAPAVMRGDVDFALVVRAPETDTWPVAVEFYYDNVPILGGGMKRIAPVIESLSEKRRDATLKAMGMSHPERVTVVTPIVLKERGIAAMREVLGERAGGMLPYVFFLFCFLGAMYPAIDLAAGEKERGTLETLLLAPVSRTAIVLGKFAVVVASAMTSAVLAAFSLGFWLFRAGDSAGEGGVVETIAGWLGAGDFALLVLLLTPTAGVIAAMLLAVSVYAKSFKEAQSYATPLQLLLFFPVAAGFLPGIELDRTTALIPFVNVALAMKEIVKGTLDPLLLMIVLGSSMVLATVFLAACVHWFSRESVLFRQ